MTIHRREFIGTGIALLGTAAAAQSGSTREQGGAPAPFPPVEHFPIWPGKPPGAPAKPIVPNWTTNNSPQGRELSIRGVPLPEVHVYRPNRPDGSAMLVFPGGGYEYLSIRNEGLDPADRFNRERTTVFILTYRLPGEGWQHRSIVPLQDAQRAMRLIRHHATDLRVDAERLGVLGFSAGGHLAADLAVSHEERVYEAQDAADRLSARPAFVGLIYPVISLDKKISQGVSRPNLLGLNPSADLVRSRSPAMHVGGDAPPSFLAAAFDDGLVHIDNSLIWIDACRQAKVKVEAHLFSEGGHGFGLHLARDSSGSLWPDLFIRWMRKHGG